MSGPAPSKARVRRAAPARGEWKSTPGVGWQHGPIPPPPDGLLAPSREAWATWMQSWFASYWTVADLPGLGVVVTAYDAVKRQAPAKANDLTALVRLMDTYGITPKGQQDRRWSLPTAGDQAVEEGAAMPSPYAGLRVVNE